VNKNAAEDFQLVVKLIFSYLYMLSSGSLNGSSIGNKIFLGAVVEDDSQ